MPKKRTTIGFMVDTVISSGNYQSDIWAGICYAAEKNNINLVCFFGGTLGDSPSNEFEYQRNSVYDLYTSGVFDGLVILCAIGTYIGHE